VEVRSLRAPHSMSMTRWIYILRGGPLRARRRADFGGAPHTSGPPRAMRRGGANNKGEESAGPQRYLLGARCAVAVGELAKRSTHLASSHHNHQQRMIVMATPSYKERMAAARAQPAQREAEWHRRIELSVEVCRMAMAATKAALRAGGDKLSRSAHARTLKDGQEQRSATSEVLHAISSAPSDLTQLSPTLISSARFMLRGAESQRCVQLNWATYGASVAHHLSLPNSCIICRACACAASVPADSSSAAIRTAAAALA
jgi:hypothetical protein